MRVRKHASSASIFQIIQKGESPTFVKGRQSRRFTNEQAHHGKYGRRRFLMSKKVSENTEEKQEKILTRYDLKMQRRAEEKKRAEKEKRMSTITGVVIVVALACLVASFPIRTYLTVNGTFVEVAGEKISRVEFDYNYNSSFKRVAFVVII